MNRHILKAWPLNFEKLCIRQRNFLFVTHNEKYIVGDLLLIQEYNPEPNIDKLTGNNFESRIIDYSNDYQKLVGLQKGYGIISIAKPFNFNLKYRNKKEIK